MERPSRRLSDAPRRRPQAAQRRKCPCTLLLVANVDPRDANFYPDSKKVYVEATDTMVRDNPQLDYFDGEPLNET